MKELDTVFQFIFSYFNLFHVILRESDQKKSKIAHKILSFDVKTEKVLFFGGSIETIGMIWGQNRYIGKSNSNEKIIFEGRKKLSGAVAINSLFT